MKNFDEIAKSLPKYSSDILNIPAKFKDMATDIRFSVGFPPMIFMGEDRYSVPTVDRITKFDMQDFIYDLCENSVYKHIEEIKNGFISYKNRFRVGLCGTAVIKDGGIENLSNISSVTIRVPRFIYGCAEDIRKNIPDFSGGVLIVGEPSSGKTTALRDIIVILSEKRLVVLDERYELTGGFSNTDIDVLYGYPKEAGINHAMRNLGAKYIICDEIEDSEISVIENAAASGVALVATIHGKFDKGLRPLAKKLLETNAFSHIVELEGRANPCKVKKVWEKNELLKNFGFAVDLHGIHALRSSKNYES